MVLERQLFSPDTWSAETFWAELAAPGRSYVVLRDDDGALLGYAGVAVNRPTADVQTVAVTPAAQGRGVGRQLLDSLVQTAAEGGASELLLEVRADNVAAQNLYRSIGFKQIARRRNYYQPGNIDALIMRLRPVVNVSGRPAPRGQVVETVGSEDVPAPVAGERDGEEQRHEKSEPAEPGPIG